MPLTNPQPLQQSTAPRRAPQAAALRRAPLLLVLLLPALGLTGCSLRGYALRSAADALAGDGSSGGGLGEEEDLDLARDAAAFGLKTMERLLVEVPDHKGLHLALASGFTQYAYAFVQQDADALEDKDIKRAQISWARARRLYLRGRDYALRGLSLPHKGFAEALVSNDAARRRAAVQQTRKEDVPLLYWAGASWALAISNAKTDANLVGDLPVVEELMAQALRLDPGYDHGTLHEFYVSYDSTRNEAQGGGPKRAKEHLDQAVRQSGGRRLGVQVSYAEGVLVPLQDRKGFTRLLDEVLAVDIYRAEPAWKVERLANVVAQQRARWLLGRLDELFAN